MNAFPLLFMSHCVEETLPENRVIESTPDTNQGMTCTSCGDSINSETERKTITERTEGDKTEH